MGGGEDYLNGWVDWYAGLNDRERSLYRWRYWPPLTWWDFYLWNSKYGWIRAVAILLFLIWFFAGGGLVHIFASYFTVYFKRQI